MPLTIGKNIAAIRAQRQLNRSTSDLVRVNERLASGQRINSAADDAAGLAISMALSVSTRIGNQAIRNLNDGASMLNISDSAAANLTGILISQRELAAQAANGVYGTTQRAAVMQEVQGLTSEYNRILAVSQFNDLPVFSALSEGVYLQGGFGEDSILEIKIGAPGNSTESIYISEITRISTDSNGVQGNGLSTNARLSSDGRYATFSSNSSNLVANDTNGQSDVFLKDLATGITTRVSTTSAGAQATGGASDQSSISGNGRYVVFRSAATNLVAGDTNGLQDLFRKDLVTGLVERVNTDSIGNQASGGGVTNPWGLSDDGRFIAFESTATNLVPSDTNGAGDIFLKDMLTGNIVRVSTDSSGNQGNGGSINPTISPDGRYVIFYSNANNLVVGDTNSQLDVFVKDTLTGTTTRVNTTSSGVEATGFFSAGRGISADGNLAIFYTPATLVPGDTNGNEDIFVKNLTTGELVRVNTTSSGSQATGGNSAWPTISNNGRWAAFESAATNLVPGDTNGLFDVFIKDIQTGNIARLNVSASGTQSTGGGITDISIVGDGRYVTFSSAATNLVAGDTNGVQDSFVTLNPFYVAQESSNAALNSLTGIDVSTPDAARASLDTIDTYINEVSDFRSNVGAAMYRIQTFASNLSTKRENEESARSRMLDADVAREVAAATRLNILQQSGSAVLAQANQQPAIALQLLQS